MEDLNDFRFGLDATVELGLKSNAGNCRQMGFVTVSIAVSARNRRRNQRIAAPVLHFVMGGEEYEARDWGLGGFAATRPGAADLETGDPVRITAVLLPDGSCEQLDIAARIVRAPPQAAEIAVEFLMLDDKTFHLLERLLVRRPP